MRSTPSRQGPPVPPVSLSELRRAIEASWNPGTAYLGVHRPGNPALGQCYPTCRVVQWFFPNLEIASGHVDTGSALEAHFWNIDPAFDPPRHVDLSWKQFPDGSRISGFQILNRHALNDSPATGERCRRLLGRVLASLGRESDCHQ